MKNVNPYAHYRYEKYYLHIIKKILLSIHVDENNDLSIISITKCILTSDKQFLLIYYDFDSDKNNNKFSKFFKNNNRLISNKLFELANVRKIPRLIFIKDKSEENYKKITDLLNK